MHGYNFKHPHQALGMNDPAELHRASPQPYCGLTEPQHPFHDRTVTVTHRGRICIGIGGGERGIRTLDTGFARITP
jgi:hypothetical protein